MTIFSVEIPKSPVQELSGKLVVKSKLPPPSGCKLETVERHS